VLAEPVVVPPVGTEAEPLPEPLVVVEPLLEPLALPPPEPVTVEVPAGNVPPVVPVPLAVDEPLPVAVPLDVPLRVPPVLVPDDTELPPLVPLMEEDPLPVALTPPGSVSARATLVEHSATTIPTAALLNQNGRRMVRILRVGRRNRVCGNPTMW